MNVPIAPLDTLITQATRAYHAVCRATGADPDHELTEANAAGWNLLEWMALRLLNPDRAVRADDQVVEHYFTIGTTPVVWPLLTAGDCDPTVAELIATQPGCAPGILERLAGHTAAPVRAAVAANLNTTTIVVDALADDPDHTVRTAVAIRRNAHRYTAA